MTMELAQAMDHCSGPDYSIWFCRYVAWIWIGLRATCTASVHGVVAMSTRSSRVQRTDTRRDFLPKVLSSQPLLLLAFFWTRSGLSQKSLGGVEESVDVIILCMRLRKEFFPIQRRIH